MIKNILKALSVGGLGWASFAATPQKAEAHLVGTCNHEYWADSNKCYKSTTKIVVFPLQSGGSNYRFEAYSNAPYVPHGYVHVTCYGAGLPSAYRSYEFHTKDHGLVAPTYARCPNTHPSIERTRCGRDEVCANAY